MEVKNRLAQNGDARGRVQGEGTQKVQRVAYNGRILQKKIAITNRDISGGGAPNLTFPPSQIEKSRIVLHKRGELKREARTRSGHDLEVASRGGAK